MTARKTKFAFTILIGILALCAGPALAQQQGQPMMGQQSQPMMNQSAQPMMDQSAKPMMDQTAKPMAKGKAQGKDWTAKVEDRVNDLHQKLMITPAQEKVFADVAQAMRDNAASMKAKWEKFRAEADKEGLTAVQRLKHYEDMADEHAQAMHKFVPVMEKLYDSLSAEQKKVADEMFSRPHKGQGHQGKQQKQQPAE